MARKSEMTISNLVKLVKYAQGGVVLETYYNILKFFTPLERKMLLSQIVELTGHFAMDDSVVELAIQQSRLSDTCSALAPRFYEMFFTNVVVEHLEGK